MVSSSRTRNHTGTASGRPAGFTVVSHAMRCVWRRVSTLARRSSGRWAVNAMAMVLTCVGCRIKRRRARRYSEPRRSDHRVARTWVGQLALQLLEREAQLSESTFAEQLGDVDLRVV